MCLYLALKLLAQLILYFNSNSMAYLLSSSSKDDNSCNFSSEISDRNLSLLESSAVLPINFI